MKGIFGKTLVVCLATVVALGSAGMAYANLEGGPQSNGSAITSCGSGPFTWVVSNDDGAEVNVSPYGIIDPGDDGGGTGYDRWGPLSSNDPSGPQSVGVPCARYDKDVARTTAWISGQDDEINVLLENAYPGYYPTVFFGLKCPVSAPGTILSIEIDNPYEYALTVSLSGIYEGQTIPEGTEIVGAAHVLVKQAAKQNHEYRVSIRITISCLPHCEWTGETAMAAGNRFPNHAWFMYTPYENAPFTVDLIAGQHYTVGTVHFSAIAAGKVTITITLDDDVRFDSNEVKVSVKGYTDEADALAQSNFPFCTWPYKGDVDPGESSFGMDVPSHSPEGEPYLFYAVHVNVQHLVCP